MIQVSLELKPVSVNSIFRGRRFKTKEYGAWRQLGNALLPKKVMVEGDVIVDLTFYVKYPKMMDVDNLCKATLDLIVEKGYIKDDRNIQILKASKYQDSKEHIDIIITKI